jgi:hypothetical protein
LQEGVGVLPAERMTIRGFEFALSVGDGGRGDVLQIDEQATINLGLTLGLVDREFRKIGIKSKLDALEQDRVVYGDRTVDAGSGLPEQVAVGGEEFEFFSVLLDKGIDVVEDPEKSHRLACGELRCGPCPALFSPGSEVSTSFAVVVEANRDGLPFLVGEILTLGDNGRLRRVIPPR